MNFKLLKTTKFLAVIMIALTSCKKDDVDPEVTWSTEKTISTSNWVFVSNTTSAFYANYAASINYLSLTSSDDQLPSQNDHFDVYFKATPDNEWVALPIGNELFYSLGSNNLWIYSGTSVTSNEEFKIVIHKNH